MENKLKTPKKIKILTANYTVKLCKDKFKIGADSSVPLWGNINHEHRTINLYSKLDNETLMEVLVHEIVHGVLIDSGLDKFIEKGNEEFFTINFGHILTDTLIRNNLIKVEK